MHLPPECLKKLECYICNRYLSLFPIYSTKNDDNQQLSVCGRCEIPDDNRNYIKNEIYESVVKTLLFPCINREYGCIEDLLPEDVKQHELICSFQPKKCIYSERNNCKWEGPFNTLLDHCKTEHNNLFLENNEFEIKTNENQDVLNVLQYHSEMFLYEFNFDSALKRLKCTLSPFGYDKTIKKYYSKIQLKNKKCTSVHDFPVIDVNENNLSSLDMKIEIMLDTDNAVVRGTIDITDTETETRPTLNLNVENVLKQFLKCGICKKFMSTPIYTCKANHLYSCNHCKSSSCRECYRCGYTSSCFSSQVSAAISDGINCMYFRCGYGCNYTGTVSDLTHHENKCLYQPKSCLLSEVVNCPYRDRLQNVLEHIFINHKDNIIRLDKTVTFKINTKNTQTNISNQSKPYVKDCKFFKFSGNWFKLFIQHKENYILWTVEVIDSIEKSHNFKYEIILSNDNGKRATIREFCGELRSNIHYGIPIGTQYCICLHENQIQDYVINETLSFNINILK